MGHQSKPQPLWEGKLTVQLTTISPEQAWPALEDFCNLHKWIPINTCYHVEGVQGQPGLVRYCSSTVKAVVEDAVSESETTVKWAKEKLLMMDPVQRCLSYEVVENNMGLESYVATLKVVSVEGDGESVGCLIEWGFVCDPVEGGSLEDFESYLEYCLRFMAKKIEVECSGTADVRT
ncbi:lachrymatory-factor synthase-like [Vicia villosa]|uniref:lachrymatory-factor synthase-like n=1 Tax=Vicia villosa TaxID=3911 RepID=UPI00273A8F67|nr:lachrymatory-factor synthase-like [Vicia villosa]